ncbi:hypothetical protein GGR21_000905 [Dysgonomonas hofstadii]|uniref:Lipoprotein n=1 Tax=Dysgonomonas hofstadii TaxID=637886 RepID=A0A840CLU8_9BACT|nr:DUF4933 domain-containing protein [Dysgonomonas hofstadii]MBB4035018.1 hypothetical protein [Dysgonomonas hofstadii]
MKKSKELWIIILLPAFLIACGGGKKQTLEAEKVDEATIAPRDSMQHSRVVYNATEETSFSKVEKPKIGKRIVSQDLVKLNLAQQNLEEKETNLDEFYTKVNYVKLQHHLTDKGLGFLGNADIKRYTKHEKGESVTSMGGFNSKVYLTENNIVAGDNYLGYHVYNNTGEFLYTLASWDQLPQYDSGTNTITYYTNDVRTEIRNFSIWGNRALISVREDTLYHTHIYNIERQEGIMAFSYMSPAFIINDNLFLAYNGSISFKDGDNYLNLISYSKQNNLLKPTSFRNYNPGATTKGRRYSPEYHTFTYYNNVLTTRQAYNDTIYRIKDENTLEAVYVLNSGAMKLSNQDASSENKENKLIIKRWLETDDFIFILSTVDQDFQNNRRDGKVKFRYYYYYKKEGKLYMKESKSLYPEEYTFGCNIDGAIPLLANTTQQLGKRLYTSYTKSQLKNMIVNKNFKNYSSEQQDKLNSLHDGLSDGELLVMILE